VVLKPAGDGTYDAYEPSNNEHAADVQNAIDGNPSTSWSTQYYLGNPKFGGLKAGTGLILDMGKQVKLSQLGVIFSKSCCTNADIYVGNTNVVSQSAFATYKKVASATNVSGAYTYHVSSSATGRYVLIWLTSLPPALPNSGAPSGSYQEQIYEVTVRGTAATSAG